MRREFLGLAATIAVLTLFSLPIFPHHGTAAFDTTNLVTVTGTMMDFVFTNPHVQLFWETKNDKGQTEKWQGELTAPNKLTRAGWTKHTLKPGDQVVVSGYAAKNGDHTLWIRKLVGPDGKSLPLFEE